MTKDSAPSALRSAKRLEATTVVWNTLETAVALGSGLVAHSVALTGFGLDSGIEIVSALVVLGRLRDDGETNEQRERRALRTISITFFVLAGYLVAAGINALMTGSRPDTSGAGIAISAAALVVMPLLARAKERVGHHIDGTLGALVLADAAETRLCALLALTTLGGVLAYSIAAWRWADPVAGFVIALFALREGAEAWHGELID